MSKLCIPVMLKNEEVVEGVIIEYTQTEPLKFMN